MDDDDFVEIVNTRQVAPFIAREAEEAIFPPGLVPPAAFADDGDSENADDGDNDFAGCSSSSSAPSFSSDAAGASHRMRNAGIALAIQRQPRQHPLLLPELELLADEEIFTGREAAPRGNHAFSALSRHASAEGGTDVELVADASIAAEQQLDQEQVQGGEEGRGRGRGGGGGGGHNNDGDQNISGELFSKVKNAAVCAVAASSFVLMPKPITGAIFFGGVVSALVARTRSIIVHKREREGGAGGGNGDGGAHPRSPARARARGGRESARPSEREVLQLAAHILSAIVAVILIQRRANRSEEKAKRRQREKEDKRKRSSRDASTASSSR